MHDSFYFLYNTMTGTKSILYSKTFRWLALSLFALIAKQFNFDFIYDDWTIDSIVIVVSELMQVLWLLIAFYGRVSANKKII